MTDNIDETYLSSAGWGPTSRDSLFAALHADGWKLDKLYDHGSAYLSRDRETLNLDLLEESLGLTYRADEVALPKGSNIVRSGSRDVALLAVSIREWVESTRS